MKVTADLLTRLDRPGPRYTSYPTAVEFHQGFGSGDLARRLADTRGPLSLYVHLPFCESRCSFCACHVVVTGRESVGARYLEALLREAELVAGLLGDRGTLLQYHWGGGTPTWYPPRVLADLHRELTTRFPLLPDAEVAVEVDPRVTGGAHLETLAELGFNRLSFGVQDLDAVVQEFIGRNQTREQTERLFYGARALGFTSINLDLVYGLPGQTEASLRETLRAIVDLGPDRLAVYSFAYVPWMRPHQKRIPEAALPDRNEKFRLLAATIEALRDAGYEHIGMDHFARPEDELAAASRAGTLTRNFMGYTTRRGSGVVALGTSAISDVGDAYAQNHRRLASYYAAVDAGELPVERGYALTDDDRIRRFVITEIMCNGRLRFADLERFGVDADYLAADLEALEAGPAADGLAIVDAQGVAVTELGRLFVRNVARVFDARTRGSDRPVFSRSI